MEGQFRHWATQSQLSTNIICSVSGVKVIVVSRDSCSPSGFFNNVPYWLTFVSTNKNWIKPFDGLQFGIINCQILIIYVLIHCVYGTLIRARRSLVLLCILPYNYKILTVELLMDTNKYFERNKEIIRQEKKCNSGCSDSRGRITLMQ